MAETVYVYEVEGHTIEIVRRRIGQAYARNGNAHNPTQYYAWDSTLDGEPLFGREQSRRSAYENARAHILGIDYYDHPNYPHRWKNVRNFRVVDAEMRANRRTRNSSQ